MTKTIVLPYQPQARQKLLHETPARLVLYGGAAGGGKSHALRWDLVEWCIWVPGIECYLFRKTYPDLEANHIRPMRLEMPIELGEWQETRKRFQFRNGSGLNFAYCERDTDVDHYQGREIHVLAVDEAAQMTPFILSYLYARNRLGGFREAVPERYQHLLPRAVFASNPGGPGHNWLKELFIDPAPAEKLFHSKQFANPQDPSDPGPLTQFIPAKMIDNIYLDAAYAGQFAGLPDELARALRDGDWDAVVGKALHLLSRERHMLRPFTPPKHWTHFMTIDWGLAVPFSVGWYTVSEGAELAAAQGLPARWLPEGAVIRYAEWYGWNGKANTGCRLPPQTVARGIIEREEARGDTMDFRVGDTEMWAQKTGPSVQEWFMETDPRLVMKQAIKDRRRNYQEVLARLAGSQRYLQDGRVEEDPMFFITSNCTQFWRTVPPLSLDENDPDKGPNTKLEDHCLSSEVRILTHVGWKRIIDVARSDLLWDGQEWVNHSGVIRRGIRATIHWAGIATTPEHNFLIAPNQWRAAASMRGSILNQALELSTAGLPLWALREARQMGCSRSNFAVRVAAFIYTKARHIFWQGGPRSVGIAPGNRVPKKPMIPIERFVQTPKPEGACCESSRARHNVAKTPKAHSTILMGLGVLEFAPNGATSSVALNPWLTNTNFWLIWRRYLAIITRPYSLIALTLIRATNRAILGLLRLWKTHKTRERLFGCNKKLTSWKPVYDILNAGPRHRFTVLTEAGPLIAHNCYDEISYALRSQPYVTTMETRQIREYEEIRKLRRVAVDPYATH